MFIKLPQQDYFVRASEILEFGARHRNTYPQETYEILVLTTKGERTINYQNDKVSRDHDLDLFAGTMHKLRDYDEH